MCGIAGFLEISPKSDPFETARAMAEILEHRGPDGWGAWTEDRNGLTVALSHRRLSIIDLRESAKQPMISRDERWVITYNGEIYNYRELRETLGELRTASDSEVLLELIASRGVPATLEMLNGMFAFAAWDRQNQEIWLARDRLGIKPLYWTRQGDVVAFASQLKSFKRHPALQLEIAPAAVTAFLRDGYVPCPQSIFTDVHKLAPGSVLKLSTRGPAEPQRYWDIREVALRGSQAPFRNADDVLSELAPLVEDAVRLRMIADVPLGAFLSGGTDSSLVTAMMQKLSGDPVKTFSIGFDQESHDEAPYARAVAAHLGTDHHELYVSGRDALELIPDLPVWYDEPFSDASQLPTFLVSRLARQTVTVALSGDGGDEFFYGYERYFVLQRLRKYFVGPPAARRLLAKGLRLGRAPDWLTEGLSKASGGRLTAGRLRRLADALELQDDIALYRWMTSVHRDPASLVRSRANDDTALPLPLDELPDFGKQMQLVDQWKYIHDDILTKVDRASMGVSLEVRVPLLDHRLMEFAWRVPTEINARHPEGKWPLRQLLYQHVPRGLLERPKKGFNVPIATWLRGPLREWAADLLDPMALREQGTLDVDAVAQLWREHLDGTSNHEGPLWAVLSFQAWRAAFDRL